MTKKLFDVEEENQLLLLPKSKENITFDSKTNILRIKSENLLFLAYLGKSVS